MKTDTLRSVATLGLLSAALLAPVKATEPRSGDAPQAVTSGKAKATPKAASTEEHAVLGRLKKLYPATTFSSVTKTPIKGLFEVVMGPNVGYVGADGTHFVFGHLFDMQRQVDLTAQRKATGSNERASYERPPAAPAKVIKLADLPLTDAIKHVNGNGSRTLIVFSDPLCPYCKRLDAELPQLADTTIYTFLIPILGDGSRKAAETQWAQAMPARAADTEVLQRNLKLASRYGINATPTLIRADGQISAGAPTLAELTRWLEAATTTAQIAPADKRTP